MARIRSRPGHLDPDQHVAGTPTPCPRCSGSPSTTSRTWTLSARAPEGHADTRAAPAAASARTTRRPVIVRQPPARAVERCGTSRSHGPDARLRQSIGWSGRGCKLPSRSSWTWAHSDEIAPAISDSFGHRVGRVRWSSTWSASTEVAGGWSAHFGPRSVRQPPARPVQEPSVPSGHWHSGPEPMPRQTAPERLGRSNHPGRVPAARLPASPGGSSCPSP